ncbi:MAG: NAD(P)H-binding protein, partial [Muribaculaceae bacterium]|nr:NAD(P)H-binding protein [Muribaculaceae bacterium]
MKNIVLLGATGYVGRALLNEALARGEKVTAIVRNSAKLKDVTSPNLTVVEGDVTDPAVIVKYAKGKDAIISAYNPGWNNPDIYEETLKNYPRILEGATESGVPRLLIVGGAGTLFVKP